MSELDMLATVAGEQGYAEDCRREEQPWTEESETLLREWCAVSERVSKEHDRKGKRMKLLHAIWCLPTVVIPVAIAPLTTILKSSTQFENLEMAALCISGVFGAVTTFYNFGGSSERHFSYSAKYSDLVTDIKYQLSKPRKFRSPCDVVTLRINMLYDSINNNAPVI